MVDTVEIDHSHDEPRIIIESRNNVPTWVLCGILAAGLIFAISALTEIQALNNRVRTINTLQADREAAFTDFVRTHYVSTDGNFHQMRELSKR